MTEHDMTPEQKERIRRADTVYGVVISVMIGFVVSILANIYYGVFVARQLTWAQIDHTQVYAMLVALLAFGGFLEFFIEDYRNELKVDRSLISRFARFFFYDYAPGRVMRWGVGLYLLTILIGFLLSAYVFVSNRIGYPAGTFLVAALLVGVYVWNKSIRNS